MTIYNRNWILAFAIFLSGANLLGLLFPFAPMIFVLFVALSVHEKLSFSKLQILALLVSSFAAIFGVAGSIEFGDLSANVRQLVVVLASFLSVAILSDEIEDVFEKYFIIFSFLATIGVVFYFLLPDFHLFTVREGVRTYEIGLSSQLLDSGYTPFSFYGPYRFQGLLEEPATFSVFSAAATYWAFLRKRRYYLIMLLMATVLSEGIAGLMVLVFLFGLHWYKHSSFLNKVIVFSGIFAILFILGSTVDNLETVLGLQSFIENKTLSADVRDEQLGAVTRHFGNLIAPSGFSVSEIFRIAPESVTSGYVRGVIQYGFVFAIVMYGIIIFGFVRSGIRRPTGILFATLLISGFSRIYCLDILMGWILFFAVLRPAKSGICLIKNNYQKKVMPRQGVLSIDNPSL